MCEREREGGGELAKWLLLYPQSTGSASGHLSDHVVLESMTQRNLNSLHIVR